MLVINKQGLLNRALFMFTRQTLLFRYLSYRHMQMRSSFWMKLSLAKCQCFYMADLLKNMLQARLISNKEEEAKDQVLFLSK